MGKVLGAILTIGGALAVNLIPGLGQVISGTIFGALGGIVGTTALTTIGQLALHTITLAGIQSLGGLLGPSSGKPEASETSIKCGLPGVLEPDTGEEVRS